MTKIESAWRNKDRRKNAKDQDDALSPEILKMEQQIAPMRQA